jgi:hypothetical protein
MEKRINTITDTYIQSFKDDICNKIKEIGFEESTKTNDLMGYIYDYEKIYIKLEDIQNKKRQANIITETNRCNAKLSNQEQCSRRRKNNCDFCGTHSKGVPYGTIDIDINKTIKKIDVFTQEIKGIVYYIDNFENVYKMEDILENKQNPAILAKYIRNERGDISIPEFGI